MNAAQLELTALPVADESFAREAALESWLRHVLDCARSVTRDEVSAPLGWWTACSLANRMREPVSKIWPVLVCLQRRGCVERAGAGAGPDGREIYMWTVRS